PRRLTPGLLSSESREDPCHEQPVVIAQIDVSGHRGYLRHPHPLTQSHEFLQLHRTPMQPIQVINNHRIPSTGLQIAQHPHILLTRLTRTADQSLSPYSAPTGQPRSAANLRQSSNCRCTPSDLPSVSAEIRA